MILKDNIFCSEIISLFIISDVTLIVTDIGPSNLEFIININDKKMKYIFFIYFIFITILLKIFN